MDKLLSGIIEITETLENLNLLFGECGLVGLTSSSVTESEDEYRFEDFCDVMEFLRGGGRGSGFGTAPTSSLLLRIQSILKSSLFHIHPLAIDHERLHTADT